MRLSREKLYETTKRQQPAAQARWFEQHFGIKIPYDQQGPIITQEAFNALVMKQLGLTQKVEAQVRPQVQPIKKRPIRN